MPEPTSQADQQGDEARKPRPRSPFLGAVGGAGEAGAGAAGSVLDTAAGLVTGLADALEGVVREAAGPACTAGDPDCEERDEPRERP